jgi:hypothetical protein
MCWLGNNRLVIASRDYTITTFAIRDHYDHDHRTRAEVHAASSSIESKSMMMGSNSTVDVSLLSQQQSSSMIRTESFRVCHREVRALTPLLIPPSMMPLISAPSTSTTSTQTTPTKNETNRRSSGPLITGDTVGGLISSCIMFSDDSVIVLLFIIAYAHDFVTVDMSNRNMFVCMMWVKKRND